MISATLIMWLLPNILIDVAWWVTENHNEFSCFYLRHGTHLKGLLV